MTEDIEGLMRWIQFCIAVAAFFATLFPAMYAFCPWTTTLLGRVMMLQSVTFALVVDLTFIFQFWTPDSMLFVFWVNAIAFSLIALSTGAMTSVLWRLNHPKVTEQRSYKRRKTDV